jgi:hypothetical protein
MKTFTIFLLLTSALLANAQNYTIFKDKHGKYGVTNEKNKVIIKPKYDQIRQNSKNFFFVVIKKKEYEKDCAILNNKGKVIVKTLDILSGSFENGFFAVYEKGKDNLSVFNEDIQRVNGPEKLYSVKIIGNYCIVYEDKTYSAQIFSKKWELLKAYDGLNVPDYNYKAKNGYDYFTVKQGNKYGLVSTDDLSDLVPAIYDNIKPSKNYCFQDDKILVLKSYGKIGFYNLEKFTRIEAVYDTITKNDNSTYFAWKGKSFDIIDKEKVITSFTDYDFAQIVKTNMSKTFIKVRKNNLTGILTMENSSVVPVRYDSISFPNYLPFNKNYDDLFLIHSKTGKMGLYSFKNGETLDVTYDKIDVYADTTCFVKKDRKWGVYDAGKFIVPNEYDSISKGGVSWTFGKRILIVKNGDKYGLLNIDTKDSTGLIYDKVTVEYASYEKGAIYTVENNSRKKLFFTDGFKTEGIDFDYVVKNNDRYQDILLLKSGDQYMYFNLKTKALLVLIQEVVRPFEDGFARIKFLDKYVTIDKNFAPVSANTEYNGERNALVIWISNKTCSDNSILKNNPMKITISEISNSAYKMTPKKLEITGGTFYSVKGIYPEDTEKDGFVKVILKKGKYKIDARVKSIYYNKPDKVVEKEIDFTSNITQFTLEIN